MRSACTVSGCESFVVGRGWCEKHYARWQRNGDPNIGRRTVADRLWRRVDRADPDACWEWTARREKFGYGQFSVGGRSVFAHRVAWELENGPIPSGLRVLHRCDNPPCINPGHLFLGTITDNNRDRSQKGRDFNGSKTHCPAGHPYEGGNLAIQRDGGRKCRTCHRERAREAYHKAHPGYLPHKRFRV